VDSRLEVTRDWRNLCNENFVISPLNLTLLMLLNCIMACNKDIRYFGQKKKINVKENTVLKDQV
jgi:hypothetical protein